MIKKIEVVRLHGYISKVINFSEENYLVGINGSGKTSILEVIEAFFKMDVNFFQKTNFKKIIIETSEDSYEIKKRKTEIYVHSKNHSPQIIELSLKELKEKFLNSEKRYNDELEKEKKVKNIKQEETLKLFQLKLEYLGMQNALLSKMKRIKELNGEFPLKELSKYLKIPKVLNIGLEGKVLEEDTLNIIKLFNQENLSNLDSELFRTLSPIKKVNKIFKQIEFQYMKLNNENQENLLNFISQNNDYNEIAIKTFLKEAQIEIIKLRKKIDSFLELVNVFYKDTCKRLVFNPSNAKFNIEVYNQNKESIFTISNFEALSSGEKQLLVILTVLYFNSGNNIIFLFDELEKSLHIEWQLKLGEEIRDLRKKYRDTQLILATHSPQIVKNIEFKKFIALDPQDNI